MGPVGWKMLTEATERFIRRLCDDRLYLIWILLKFAVGVFAIVSVVKDPSNQTNNVIALLAILFIILVPQKR